MSAPLRRTQAAAVVVGNWLEFYDFTVYAYFALQIGDAFFPSHSDFARLMASLITYGVGFVCRPIGAVVIGRYADRAGRRPAMLLSFSLMGLALLALVATPTYRQIGVAAPALVVACRLVQGFALGGEVGPTTAFLIEAAPAERRGLYGAWQIASQALASLTGGVVGVILARLLSAAQLHAWGWRIAFLIGALVLPFGLALRRSLIETREEPEERLAAHPQTPPGGGYWSLVAAHWRTILLGLGLITGGTIATYILIFMTTYAQTTLHLPVGIAFWGTVANGAVGFIGALAGGWLSDRLGRRALMIWPRLALLVAIWPAFEAMVSRRDPATFLGSIALLSLLAYIASATTLVALTEALRREVRGLGVAMVYAAAVAVFGGTTQPIVAWLGHATGDPMAIAWYMMAATAVALLASVLMTETREWTSSP